MNALLSLAERVEAATGPAEFLGLEHGAADGVWAVNEPPSEAGIEHSKAISLKRIADALWGTNDTTGIIQRIGQ